MNIHTNTPVFDYVLESNCSRYVDILKKSSWNGVTYFSFEMFGFRKMPGITFKHFVDSGKNLMQAGMYCGDRDILDDG